MTSKLISVFTAILFAITIITAGCGGEKKDQAVTLVGSTSVLPFAELLAEKYAEDPSHPNVDPQGGGSTAGIIALTDGIAQIGMCSRALKPEEAEQFVPHAIAYDGIAIVVHRDNPMKNLTKEQAQDIFSGKITNWNQLSEGYDEEIRVVMREEGSGTREAFMHMVMGDVDEAKKALVQESNGSVKEFVRNARGGIGYISLGLVDDSLKALDFEGVPATAEKASTKEYTLVRPFLFVTKQEVCKEAQDFIDFVMSPEAQKLLEKEGLIRAK